MNVSELLSGKWHFEKMDINILPRLTQRYDRCYIGFQHLNRHVCIGPLGADRLSWAVPMTGRCFSVLCLVSGVSGGSKTFPFVSVETVRGRAGQQGA